jgi:hypothetical protein
MVKPQVEITAEKVKDSKPSVSHSKPSPTETPHTFQGPDPILSSQVFTMDCGSLNPVAASLHACFYSPLRS